MVVCLQCRNLQEAGAVCAQCGSAITPAGLSAPVAPPSADIQQTRFAPAAAAVDEFPFDELEPTAEARLPSYEIERVPGLENFSGAAPAAAPVARMEGIDAGRFAFVGGRTVLKENVAVCRYCRVEQPPGALCIRCGMKLPALAAPRDDAASGEPEPKRCRACGAKGTAGARCGDCGVLIAPD